MTHRDLLVLALFAGLPATASAQFTTFIAPHSKAADSAKTAVVAQQRAQADSVMRIQLTNMKAWVDSAAGVAPAPTTAADSLASSAGALAKPAKPDSSPAPRRRPDSASVLRDGARAPDTASKLPLLALVGVITLSVGTVMLAGSQIGRDDA
jgi:hypothetical protein